MKNTQITFNSNQEVIDAIASGEWNPDKFFTFANDSELYREQALSWEFEYNVLRVRLKDANGSGLGFPLKSRTELDAWLTTERAKSAVSITFTPELTWYDAARFIEY
tara:strand:+ start:5989 stop:6309 length:321 start_codon:yes stop_codon:yes gene_type:complete